MPPVTRWIVLSLFLWTPLAESIGPRPFNEYPKAELAFADAVFTAQVLVTVPVFTDLPYENSGSGFQYFVKIQSVWKGDLPETLWLHSPAWDEDNGRFFQNGSRYLIYASRIDEMVYTDTFYRGRLLTDDNTIASSDTSISLAEEIETLGAPLVDLAPEEESAEIQMILHFEDWAEAGNDVNGEFGDSGVTPLQIAALNNQYKSAGALMGLGAELWIDTPALPWSPAIIVHDWLNREDRAKNPPLEFSEPGVSNRYIVQSMFATRSREHALLIFIIAVFTLLVIRVRYLTKTSPV